MTNGTEQLLNTIFQDADPDDDCATDISFKDLMEIRKEDFESSQCDAEDYLYVVLDFYVEPKKMKEPEVGPSTESDDIRDMQLLLKCINLLNKAAKLLVSGLAYR